MTEIKINANEALEDALTLLAEKDRENTMLRIQLSWAMRQLSDKESDTDDGINSVDAG